MVVRKKKNEILGIGLDDYMGYDLSYVGGIGIGQIEFCRQHGVDRLQVL